VSTVSLNSIPEFRAPQATSQLNSCVVVDLPVSVSGHDLAGVAFVDCCRTIAIAANGAIVIVNRTLGTEQEVFLRHKDQEVMAHVVGHSGAGNYGFCCAAPDPGFWGDILVEPLTETDPLLITNCDQFGQAIMPKTPPKSEERRGERRRSPRMIIRQAKAVYRILSYWSGGG
jgi:hypothetical protein